MKDLYIIEFILFRIIVEKHMPKLFSERHGLKKVFRFGDWAIEFIRNK